MSRSQQVIITNSSKQTQQLGEKIAKRLQKGAVLALFGDLGSGKTTFVQGVAKGLGIVRRISSPTFIIVRTYKIRIKNQESRIKNFYHIDLYRVKGQTDIEGLGLREILADSSSIVTIEWPEKISGLLPRNTIEINFTCISETQRHIEVITS